jgi:hypothetical protein
VVVLQMRCAGYVEWRERWGEGREKGGNRIL